MTPREWMLVILAGVLLLGVLLLWRAQRSNVIQFDAFDLIMENGKVSKIALAFMVVLGVTTWIMVYLTIAGKMTEGYLGLYCVNWVAPLVIKIVFNKNDIPGTISTMTVTQQTSEVTKP